MVTGTNMNMDDNLDERYAWVDQRLEQLYTHSQDEDENEDEDNDNRDIYLSEDDNNMDIIHLNAYDQGEGDEDFRVICRRLFPNDDDNEATEADILSEMSVGFHDCNECSQGEVLPPQIIQLPIQLWLPPAPIMRRTNTQFQVNGVTIYNGNPNGSRFFEEDYANLEPIT